MRDPVSRPCRAALLLVVALPSCSLFDDHEATAENTYMTHSEGDLDAQLVDEQDVPAAPPPATEGTPTEGISHGAASRQRVAALQEDLDGILALTLPEVRSLQAELDSALARIPAPEKLATQQPGLGHWREELLDIHKEQVGKACDETERRLKMMHVLAMDAALEQARTLAAERGPLDVGRTGDLALDSTLEQFSEVLDGALGLPDLDLRRSQETSQIVELFEIFNSFALKEPDGTTAAEDRMNGRLLLFVGGDETGAAPRAVFAFRDTSADTPRTRVVAQVTRHRILRGSTIVKDYGWRAAPVKGRPGLPETEVLENYLIAPAVEPILNRAADAYDQLRDLRVQIDLQTGVFETNGTPIGGVDWRLEFSVSARGELTWQLESGKPVYDPYCSEILKVMKVGNP
jgi:hypothetical protein